MSALRDNVVQGSSAVSRRTTSERTVAAAMALVQSGKAAQTSLLAGTTLCTTALSSRDRGVASMHCRWMETASASATSSRDHLRQRSHMCGAITEAHIGETVTLLGWLQHNRAIGGIVFILLRDYSGEVQCTWEEVAAAAYGQEAMEAFLLARSCPTESVVAVRGIVTKRPGDMVNSKQKTGALEVQIVDFAVLNPADQLPIAVNSENTKEIFANEDVRLKYRYLDLRRQTMQRTLRLRSRLSMAVRQFLVSKDFVEVETPYLFKSTPEGAREFLVPTRTVGKFYALPQSPQQYKQLLMSAGVERYFQLARCFRDEGGRPDRQPEFTQIDLEMSFATADDVKGVVEGVVQALLSQVSQRYTSLPSSSPLSASIIPLTLLSPLSFPLPSMTYDHAMNTFGSDKPDTRFGFHMNDITTAVAKHLSGVPGVSGEGFAPLDVQSRTIIHSGGVCKVIVATGMAKVLTKATIEALQAEARLAGSMNGLCIFKADKWKVPKSFAALASGPVQQQLSCLLSPSPSEDVVIACAGEWNTVCKALGRIRLTLSRIAQDAGLLTFPPDQLDLFWVTDFPLFDTQVENAADIKEVRANTQGEGGHGMESSPASFASSPQLQAQHHPFTAVHPEDAEELVRLLEQVLPTATLPTTASTREETPSISTFASPAPSAALSSSACTPILAPFLCSETIRAASKIRGLHYDLVANGMELGGGSIRIHEARRQDKILRLLGANPAIFSHLLDALRFGCPPHGGLALGFDRLVGILASVTSTPLKLRDVIAFPKTAHGSELMVASPSQPTAMQLGEYHIKVVAHPAAAK